MTGTCSGGMGEDPLDMASSTGRSCGTVGIETGMMDFVTCPISGKEENTQINNRNQICMHSSSMIRNYGRHELKTTLRSLICGSRPKTPPTESLQLPSAADCWLFSRPWSGFGGSGGGVFHCLMSDSSTAPAEVSWPERGK